MQAVRRIPSGEGAEMRGRSETNRVRRKSHGSSLRVRQPCTCSGRPGSAKCVRHGFLVPSDEKLMRKASDGSREVLRRALTPPIRRMNLRWLNFRPTPSRLCKMSSV
ncbi:uncharacterized protein LOC103869910 [Brassica rapa]|uniref:Uncharacterized protein n=2 Tax=Brassica TaxID=3705 RepID=A0A3P5ZK52_BRACM|nr:uncharacterized protein LOC106406648 [Brassica napus]XP_033148728.1 uncharacterized protein LOC103869910 [Brassica rapa]CAF2101227.1 unnamed protein product [Brassica napus]CAG7877478.1 unnamed protein product [Brassica rapa]VDC72498.1 unnamed protein product [Brassica rapa]